MPLVRFPDAAGKTLLLMEYQGSGAGDEKFLGPPDLEEEVMSDVHNIAIREDDVFLCSYPKTGCHWLWEMARLLRGGSAEAEVVEKESYMIEFKPQEDLAKLPPRRVFNTHDYFRQLPPAVQAGKTKVLFIYRNPKDVAVSFYNHHRKFHEYEYSGEFPDYLPELFLKGRVDWGDYFAYLRDWEAVLDSRPDLPVFRLSYEELQADTLGKARELARFLGSSADDDTLRDIVDKCSFGSMRERKGKEWTQQYGEPVMYRKGKVGDWKNWFTVAHSEMMDLVIQREMKGSKFHFQYTL